MKNYIDMQISDFVTVYGAILETILKNNIPEDYRISILCSRSDADIDIYPPSDVPYHKSQDNMQ